MANDEKKEYDQIAEQTAGQPKIIWDDTNMRSVYANVSNVTGGREEIVLLFGMNQAWHSGQKEVTVQLTDRVVMSPFAAKRHLLLLNKVVQDYEKRFGTVNIGLETQPPPSGPIQ